MVVDREVDREEEEGEREGEWSMSDIPRYTGAGYTQV